MKLEINQPNKCGKCRNLIDSSSEERIACPTLYAKMQQQIEQLLTNKDNSADVVPNLMYEAYNQCLCGCDKFNATALDSEVCAKILSTIAFKLICKQLAKEIQNEH